MTQILLIITLGVLPIFLWGLYFNIKNPRRQSMKEILKIFGLGTLSIIPVLIFHKWLLDMVMLTLVSSWSFLEMAFAEAVLELVLTLMFVGLFIGIFAFLHSLWVRMIYKMPIKLSFQAVRKKLYSLAPILFVFALFLIIEALSSFSGKDSFILSIAGSTIVFAVLEEYFKYIINPFLVYKRINSVGTAMVHALYVGLAFSFVENLLFFFDLYGSEGFAFIFLYRSIITTLLHVCASGILGYFYGLSIFSKAMLTNYEIEKSEYHIPAGLQKFLKKGTIFKTSVVTQGFFLAAFIHALFNLLITMDKQNIAAVMVIAFAIGIVLLLRSKPVQIQYGLIGSTTMPEEDFEKLRLQISVLQHTEEIQNARKNIGDT